jgi:hypothetical protein
MPRVGEDSRASISTSPAIRMHSPGGAVDHDRSQQVDRSQAVFGGGPNAQRLHLSLQSRQTLETDQHQIHGIDFSKR